MKKMKKIIALSLFVTSFISSVPPVEAFRDVELEAAEQAFSQTDIDHQLYYFVVEPALNVIRDYKQEVENFTVGINSAIDDIQIEQHIDLEVIKINSNDTMEEICRKLTELSELGFFQGYFEDAARNMIATLDEKIEYLRSVVTLINEKPLELPNPSYNDSARDLRLELMRSSHDLNQILHSIRDSIAIAAVPGIEINFNYNGKVITKSFPAEACVSDVRNFWANELGANVENVMLFYAGRELLDGVLLSRSRIKPGKCVTVALREVPKIIILRSFDYSQRTKDVKFCLDDEHFTIPLCGSDTIDRAKVYVADRLHVNPCQISLWLRGGVELFDDIRIDAIALGQHEEIEVKITGTDFDSLQQIALTYRSLYD